MIFRSTLGYSGTPSDLVPESMHDNLKYEKGMDGLGGFVTVLSDAKKNGVYYEKNDWTVEGFLQYVAREKYHALIDTGALINGFTNEGVIRYMLNNGLRDRGIKAGVFLDPSDKQMAVTESGGQAHPSAQLGVEKSERFTFYDQIHTVGIDIKQSLDARAIITLGKGMQLRDFAQGAYRMRKIEYGQSIM